MLFDPTSSDFYLKYGFLANVSGPTEIYLNEPWYYPNGYTVSIEPSGAATWKSTEKNFVHVTHTGSAFTELTIQITKK